MSEKQFEELKELFNRFISRIDSLGSCVFWGLIIHGCMTRWKNENDLYKLYQKTQWTK